MQHKQEINKYSVTMWQYQTQTKQNTYKMYCIFQYYTLQTKQYAAKTQIIYVETCRFEIFKFHQAGKKEMKTQIRTESVSKNGKME